MTAMDYVKHYITPMDSVIFFLIALGLVVLVNLILYLSARIGSKPSELHPTINSAVKYNYSKWIQRFYELFFSCSSILFFVAAYYLLDRFYNVQPYKSYLIKYDSLVLLVLIILSCVLTTLMDRVFVRLNLITIENRGPIRFMGMIYMAVIFWYIKFIYENDNYDTFIAYFLGLMIGRFVYFDASFKDFASTVGEGFKNFPLLLLALGCTAVLAYYGFKTEFLIKHIGVVTNTYIAHVFMCIAIFIVHHLHPENWIKDEEEEKDEGNLPIK